MRETVDITALVKKASDGENAAFEELYNLTFKTAYHTASLLLKSPDDVEDVLQNSYAKAFQKLPELKNPESFESWIKTIVENETRNFIKKEKRFTAPVLFFKNRAEENSEEWNQPVPQEFMERDELRKSVADILDKLSPEIRACIVLFHYEEKSLNEISELLDIPLGTVKSRLHNGRKQIEKEFNKLRKKDPTIYSIAAIPAVLSVLSFRAKNIAVPAALSESVLTSAISTASATGAAATVGGTAAGAAVTAGSTAATGSVAATAATSIAVKVAAVAVAGSVAVGGSVALKNHVENKTKTETTTSYTTVYESEESGTVAEMFTSLSTTESTSAVSETIITAVKTTDVSAQNTEKQTVKTTVSKSNSTTVAPSTASTTVATTVMTTAATTQTTTTTKPTTTKRVTTTAAPTTNPENNFGVSGGVITEYTGSDSSVSIPSSIGSDKVTAIGSGAFSGNTSVKSVSVPSSVTQIGQEAFADCTSLSSVSLPSSLELIGIGAFYGCSSLTAVSVPDGTKTISDEAFAQCSALKTVTIPSSVTAIASDAFDGCNSLTIRCEEGSAAHDFAVSNGITFSLI